LGEEDGEWVLIYRVGGRREMEGEKWLRIGTENRDWRHWCTRKEGKERQIDVIALEEGLEWVVLR
jgi:hypothetical protein